MFFCLHVLSLYSVLIGAASQIEAPVGVECEYDSTNGIQLNPIVHKEPAVSYKEGSFDEMAAGIPPKVVSSSSEACKDLKIEILCPICATGGKRLTHFVVGGSSNCDYKVCDDCVKELRQFRGICPNCRKRIDYSKYPNLRCVEEARIINTPTRHNATIVRTQPRSIGRPIEAEQRDRSLQSSHYNCENESFGSCLLGSFIVLDVGTMIFLLVYWCPTYIILRLIFYFLIPDYTHLF